MTEPPPPLRPMADVPLAGGDSEGTRRALRHAIGQQASVWPLQLIPARHWLIQATTNGAKITETMLINLIRMLRLGPEVSLNGSPTVSPMTAAL